MLHSVLQKCRECSRHLSPLLPALEAWAESETKVGKLARSRLVGLMEMMQDYVPRGSGTQPKLTPLSRP